LLPALVVLCLFANAGAAPAQDWPQQPIHLIVSFGPGGGADIIGRILADAMQDRLGKPVIVENKPGAGGILGNELVANTTPDGYTLGVMTAGQIIAAVTRKNMPYNTAALTPVAQIAGINLLHVPFRTTPEAINAVLGHHADVLFDTVSALLGQVQSGALKALAVTGKDRFPALPNVPAASESGVLPGYDVTTWYGVFGPPGVPAPIVGKLSRTLMDILADDKVRAHLVAVGVVIRGSTAAEFGTFMADEYNRWSAVREAAGISQQ
jgi:tripartite-type tricarboxylate transporter receptor subunit TctC